MEPTAADVDAFLEAVRSPDRRADGQALCALLADITGEPPVLWGTSILGFGRYAYRYRSGREGRAPLASFSPRSTSLVVYLAGGYADRDPELLNRLGPHRTGTSCLYVKRLADIDLGVLRELIVRSFRAHGA